MKTIHEKDYIKEVLKNHFHVSDQSSIILKLVWVVAPMTAFWFPRCWVLHTELYTSNRHTEIFETINAQKQFSLSCRAKTKMASRMLVTKSGGTSELLLGTKLFEFLQVKLDELLSWDLYSRLQSCSHWGTISMFSTVSIVLLIPDHKAGLHAGCIQVTAETTNHSAGFNSWVM